MVSINGNIAGKDEIAREATLYVAAVDPDAAARRSVAMRELMLQRAGELGMLEAGARATLSRSRTAPTRTPSSQR